MGRGFWGARKGEMYRRHLPTILKLDIVLNKSLIT